MSGQPLFRFVEDIKNYMYLTERNRDIIKICLDEKYGGVYGRKL